jgi:hypothetical protein
MICFERHKEYIAADQCKKERLLCHSSNNYPGSIQRKTHLYIVKNK